MCGDSAGQACQGLPGHWAQVISWNGLVAISGHERLPVLSVRRFADFGLGGSRPAGLT